MRSQPHWVNPEWQAAMLAQFKCKYSRPDGHGTARPGQSLPPLARFAKLAGLFLVRNCVVSDEQDDNVVDLAAARARLEPVRKEKAAKDIRKQFQKAMGWNSWPKGKKPGGSKGPGKGTDGNGPSTGGGKRKKK